MNPANDNICVVYPNKHAYSETFIQAHVQYLPCNVHVLYGGWFPTATGDDIPLSSFFASGFPYRGIEYLQHILGNSFSNHVRRKALSNYFKRKKIKAVMAEYGPTGLALMEVCEACAIPLIVHFHGFDAYSAAVLNDNKEAYRELFRKAAALIAVSTDMKRQLLSLGAPEEKVFCNPCGVDTQMFRPKDRRTDEPLFLYVGRFVNKKAPHLVIQSFSLVREKIPDAKLIMIGEGNPDTAGELYLGCKQLVIALKLEQSVEFTGALPHGKIADVMRRSLVFVQHSVRPPESGDSEGTPVTVLEACASGLPVIATRHGGIRDVVDDGVTGYLVDEYDTQAMAERMILLAQNATLAHEMGQSARTKILTGYSMTHSIENLWSVINDSMHRP